MADTCIAFSERDDKFLESIPFVDRTEGYNLLETWVNTTNQVNPESRPNRDEFIRFIFEEKEFGGKIAGLTNDESFAKEYPNNVFNMKELVDSEELQVHERTLSSVYAQIADKQSRGEDIKDHERTVRRERQWLLEQMVNEGKFLNEAHSNYVGKVMMHDGKTPNIAYMLMDLVNNPDMYHSSEQLAIRKRNNKRNKKNSIIRKLLRAKPDDMESMKLYLKEIENLPENEIESIIAGLNNKDFKVAQKWFAKFIGWQNKNKDRSQVIEDNLPEQKERELGMPTTEEFDVMTMVYRPMERVQRANMVARKFSEILDRKLQEKIAECQALMDTVENEKAKEHFKRKMDSLTRLDVLNEITPRGIMEEVRMYYHNHLQLPIEERKRLAREKLEENYFNVDDEMVDILIERENRAYAKLLKNFNAISYEALRAIAWNEDIEISNDYSVAREENQDETSVVDEEESEGKEDGSDKEDTPKDGWMKKFRKQDSFNSLTPKVKKVISEIAKKENEPLEYIDEYGEKQELYTNETDELGDVIHLNPNYVHNVLLECMSKITEAKEMMPALERLQGKYPWVEGVIEKLEEDEVFKSQFYSCYRRAYTNYAVQRYELTEAGGLKVTFVDCSKPISITYLTDRWRSNYESGDVFSDISLYDKEGELSKENAKEIIKLIDEVTNELLKSVNRRTPSASTIIKRVKGNIAVLEKIQKALLAIGINNIDIYSLESSLLDYNKKEESINKLPVLQMLDAISQICERVEKGHTEKMDPSTNKPTMKGTLITGYKGFFMQIAKSLGRVFDDVHNESIHENGSTYSCYTTPNFMDTLVKKMSQTNMTEEEYKQYLEEEFGQYEWFKKDGVWLSGFLHDMANNEDSRKQFKHKVILHADGKEYKDWSVLDYAKVSINEFFSNLSGKKKNYAWYPVPVLSDTDSAEYLRMKVYSGLEREEKIPFIKDRMESEIISRLASVVLQEYNRIQLVRDRYNRWKNGENIELQQNFDIIEEGDNIILNGAEFKFFPSLNQGDFLKTLDSLVSRGEDATEYIQRALSRIMNDKFMEFYSMMEDNGLFEETKSGMSKHIMGFGGRDEFIKSRLEILDKVLDPKEHFALSPELVDHLSWMRQELKRGKVVRDEIGNEIFKELKRQLGKRKSEFDEFKLSYSVPDMKSMKKFFYNSTYAATQIMEITITDPAYYSSVEDLFKRIKELHAPATRLNTEATYKGEKVGREMEKAVYLKDFHMQANILEELEKVLEQRVEEGKMTELDKEIIMNKYKDVNVTDGQSYRSMDSYRAVMIMGGKWTEEMEESYQRMMSGQWNMNDFNTVWQVFKPYVYTNISVDNQTGDGTFRKVGVQHKNSEFPLLAMYQMLAGPLKQSEVLKGLSMFMEKHKIDVVHFESVVKTGGMGTIEITETREDMIVRELEYKTGITKSTPDGNPLIVHKIPYKDYGWQQENPEHGIDASILYGIQIKKLIMADMEDSFSAILKGMGKEVKFDKDKWLQVYQSLHVENIIDSYLKTKELFNDPRKVTRRMMEEISRSARYGLDTIRSVMLDENGKPAAPYGDPAVTTQIQNMLTSIIRKAIVKQKAKGGQFIQVTSYGMTNQLSIVFKDKNGQEISYDSWKKNNKGGTREEYHDYIRSLETSDGLSLYAYECYMPAYSKKFLQPLMKKGTEMVTGKDGKTREVEYEYLDINELPGEMRECLGYRIPTEAKYSMLPLRIKGFLPMQNGNSIVLPAEITTITDSDFDIDKLYIFFYEFYMEEYDMDKAWNLFKREMEQAEGLLEHMKLERIELDRNNPEDYEAFMEWFGRNKDDRKLGLKYRKAKPRKIQYDPEMDPKDMSRAQRNNMLLDMNLAALRNPEASFHILNPGGPSAQARAAYTVRLLKRGIKLEDIRKMSDKELKAKVKAYETGIGLAFPQTQISVQQRNMSGMNMLPIYANHNPNHGLLQAMAVKTKIPVTVQEEYRFSFFGEHQNMLSGIHDRKGGYISKNLGGFVAAAADNAKNPVLFDLNQNLFTADASITMLRLGYTVEDLAIIMNQPVIKRLSRLVLDSNRYEQDNIIIDLMKELSERMDTELYEKIRENSPSLEELSKALAADNLEDMDARMLAMQYHVLIQFSSLLNVANDLSKYAMTTKPDGGKSGVGPTIADIVSTILKYQKVAKQLQSCSINFGKDPLPVIDFDNIDEFREEVRKSSMPMTVAMEMLAVYGALRMLKNYFPQANYRFIELAAKAEEMSRSGIIGPKMMNKLFNEYMAYLVSGSKYFSYEVKDDAEITSRMKRSRFINRFPAILKSEVSAKPKLSNSPLFHALKVKHPEKSPVPEIEFRNGGRLTSYRRELYMSTWEATQYSKDEEIRSLGLDMFAYNFYRNGLAFGPNSFAHLAPIGIRKRLPGYFQQLDNLLSESQDDTQDVFFMQFVRNHLENNPFTYEVKKGLDVLKDKEGKWAESITVNGKMLREQFNAGKSDLIKNVYEYPDGGFTLVMKPFIKVHTFMEDIYYYSTYDSKRKQAVFKRIRPLGHPNMFLEYEYGEGNQYIETAIKPVERKTNKNKKMDSNKLNEIFNSTKKEKKESSEEDSSVDKEDAKEKEYDSNGSFSNFFNFSLKKQAAQEGLNETSEKTGKTKIEDNPAKDSETNQKLCD